MGQFEAILGRIEGDPDLASQPTLCRLENRITRQELKAMIIYPIEKWLESYKTVPNEIILDFPNVKIKLRADSGVAIPRFFDFLEDNTIQYGTVAKYLFLRLVSPTLSSLTLSKLR